ncbi:MAG: type I pullulanase [Phycisphaerae bacterium]|nr:type I pullulanase [Phycisphaerae bacterium]
MAKMKSKLVHADLSTEEEVTVRLAERCPLDEVRAADFAVITEDGLEIGVAAVRAKFARDGQAKTYGLRTARPLDFTRHTYRVRVRECGEVGVKVNRLLADPAKFCDRKAVMGAACTPQGTTFRLFAPTARSVRLVIADTPDDPDSIATHDLNRAGKGIWHLYLQGDWRGKFYSYRVSTPGGGTSGMVTDPSALCACGLRPRTMLVHLENTDPPGFDPAWQPQIESYVDAVVYEMNIRDFTIAANSGVKHRGLFLGLTESGTHLPKDPAIRTGIDHLVELGITHVQLMPVQDFENEETPDGPYNWGYMPVHFNSPDGWFATAPIGDSRIREFKQAVQAFHDRGIAVCMDVVYNHTSPCASFNKIVPGYYYRTTADGQLSNGSGCGNEFNSENPMARKFMIESLCYWVTQYGIDGFRFDLMALHAPRTMFDIRESLRRIKPNIMLYGEPWTGGATALRRITDRAQVRGKGIAAFNDGFRDAIKGGRDGGGPGFIQTGDRIDGVKDGVTGSIGNWTEHPSDAIQYCEAHDNLTTWDKLVQSAPHLPDDIRKRMQCFAGFIMLTAQGVPLIHSGQEFCRTKHGNNNSYNAPDEINRIDWSLKRANFEVFEYYRSLIALRKAHPVFRLRNGDAVRKYLAFVDELSHGKCFAYTLDGSSLPRESWSQAIVLLNGDSVDQTFSLPKGQWQVHADHQRVSVEPMRKAKGSVTLKSHSGMVLAGKSVGLV